MIRVSGFGLGAAATTRKQTLIRVLRVWVLGSMDDAHGHTNPGRAAPRPTQHLPPLIFSSAPPGPQNRAVEGGRGVLGFGLAVTKPQNPKPITSTSTPSPAPKGQRDH